MVYGYNSTKQTSFKFGHRDPSARTVFLRPFIERYPKKVIEREPVEDLSIKIHL